jgi:hypothetical protein
MRKTLLISFITLLTTSRLFAQTHTAWVENHYCGPYTGAHDITVDNLGNVYVTGECSMDYITIKYYPNGDTAWTRKHNSAGNGEDVGYAIAVDDSGNVFVTGVTGLFYSGIGSYDDITTIKYYPNGDTSWVRDYSHSANSEEFVYDIAVDGSGNCYVTGYSHGWMSLRDFVTIKYYPNGDTAWLRRYNGPDNGGDESYAITVDSTENVYVTGRSYANEKGQEYTTIKYDSSGNETWVRRYTGSANGWDEAKDIAVDKDGNVYVTGRTHNSVTGFDLGTIKYDLDGDELWVRIYSGTETYYEDRAYDVAVDDFNNVYVSGITGYYPDYNYLTIKYDSLGSELWARIYDGPANSQDYCYDMAVDNYGNVYVTGWSAKVSGDPWSLDFATVMYNQDGNELCVKRYGGSGDEEAFALTVDDSANVYVTGSNNGVGLTTIKYYPIGMAGDTNGDENVTLSDIVYLINYLFKGGATPNPIGSADVNYDESVNLNDIIYLINYLFKSGPPPIC